MRTMTNVSRLMYAISVVIFGLSISPVVLSSSPKYWILCLIITISAAHGFNPNKWSVILATFTAFAMTLIWLRVLHDGDKIAALFSSALLLLAIVNRYSPHHRNANTH